MTEFVRVLCRVKPTRLVSGYSSSSLSIESEVHKIYKTQLKLEYRDSTVLASFSRVFGSTLAQEEVYSYFSNTISKLQGGTNISLVAYGHTGSGKTYTMYGGMWPALASVLVQTGGWHEKPDLARLPGLSLRLADQLFSELNTTNENTADKYSVSLRYFQIYNEKIIDLLTVIIQSSRAMKT